MSAFRSGIDYNMIIADPSRMDKWAEFSFLGLSRDDDTRALDLINLHSPSIEQQADLRERVSALTIILQDQHPDNIMSNKRIKATENLINEMNGFLALGKSQDSKAKTN